MATVSASFVRKTLAQRLLGTEGSRSREVKSLRSSGPMTYGYRNSWNARYRCSNVQGRMCLAACRIVGLVLPRAPERRHFKIPIYALLSRKGFGLTLRRYSWRGLFYSAGRLLYGGQR